MSVDYPDIFHLRAAEGWLELGNWEEAHAELECVSPRYLAHPETLQVRWHLHAALKQWDLAVELAKVLTKAEPEVPFGWIQTAYGLHELKKTEEAYLFLKPAVEAFPKEWVMRYNMACYSCQLGKMEEAREWLQSAYLCGNEKQIQQMASEDLDLLPLRKTILSVRSTRKR
ncbi:MAG: hypothetical protein JWN25_2979 [Verrucomicrobiales bacterium]|jgi:tetratricopeptide (TPR) repeat protein|nr:hypothetical protein [Verrucomicrobiales bacterium]MDB6130036.1 hypothetical protein [Verrucomicrobiales bacterium]